MKKLLIIIAVLSLSGCSSLQQMNRVSEAQSYCTVATDNYQDYQTCLVNNYYNYED